MKLMHPSRPSNKATTFRRFRPLTALSVLGSCLALAACGSSSNSTSTTGTTSASAGTAPKGAQAAGRGRFTAVRSCLAKQGITLPAPSGNRPPAGTGTPGQGGPFGGGGAGRTLPKGVSRTQLQEALKKCGGGAGGGGRFSGAAGKAALTKFVACMRENGVTLPVPNTSGNGPVFNTKKVNTTSAAFKSATAKCQSDLRGGAGSRGGGGSSSESAAG